MTAVVSIMRGMPGSGKSTKARTITTPEFICSADDHFMKDGKYVFLQHEIGKAHAECLRKFIGLLYNYRKDAKDIVVDNTNLRVWEFLPYIQLAAIAGCPVEFHEFVPPRDNTLGDYVRLCASRNIHGVSPNACMRMASIFEVRNG